jgi:hypothetical protein
MLTSEAIPMTRAAIVAVTVAVADIERSRVRR